MSLSARVCETGREHIQLVGIEVAYRSSVSSALVDLTDTFLERARADAARIGVDLDYRRGDLRDLPTSGPFDAVICWFTSFGYFDDDDNRHVLVELARVLRPGGCLALKILQ